MKVEMAVALASVASACAFVSPSAFTGGMVAPSVSSPTSLEMIFGSSKKAPAPKKAAPKAPVKKGPVSKGSSFESELGAQPPLGFYDPAGLLTNADQER